MPKISPRWSVNVADPGSSAVTSRMASPRVRCVRGNKSPTGRPTMRLTGGALERLHHMMPPGYKPIVHVSLTDDPPVAQAFVVIEAQQM